MTLVTDAGDAYHAPYHTLPVLYRRAGPDIDLRAASWSSGVCMSRPSPDHEQPASSPSAKTTAEVLLSTELLEAFPDAIVAVDRGGTIVQANSQAQELFGYERDELIGQKVEMLVPESYRRQHDQHRENFAHAPRTRRMGADLDLYGRRRNGSEFPV